MLTYPQAKDTVFSHINTEWAEATEIAWPDLEFKPDSHTAFIRASMNQGDGTQMSLGAEQNRLFRNFGVIIVQVFAQRNDGGFQANELAQQAKAMLHKKIPGLLLRNPRITDIGVRNEKKGSPYYQVNVTVDYSYDEIA